MSTIQYRHEIDGLRAVAILPVLLFHLGLTWLPGGYLGVDVFFVISGFLITTILLRESDAGSFSFKKFWIRRVRRILPALLVVTGATLVAAWILVFPSDRPAIGRQALATLFSVANFFFWRHANDYWGPQAEDSPFLHAWSLAVEEQFYVLYPFIVYAAQRWAPRWLVASLVMIAAASLGLFLIGIHVRPSATFYLLPTRAWELAIGGLVAALSRIPQPQDNAVAPGYGWAAAAGLFGILASYIFVSQLSGWTVVPVLGAALVIGCATRGKVNQLLSHPALVFIGRISYSLYLWHWPVIVLSRQLPQEVSTVAVVLLTGLFAVASYYMIEEPFRRRQRVIPLIAGAFVIASSVAAFLAVWPVPRYDTSLFEPYKTYSFYYDIHPHRTNHADWIAAHATADTPDSIAPPGTYLREGIVTESGNDAPSVVVLGDSHGCMWSHAIRVAADEAGLRTAFYSMGGVPPFFEFPPRHDCRAWNLTETEKHDYDLARAENIQHWKPSLVFICARWSIYKPNTADRLLEFLGTHAERVVLVEQPPELKYVGENSVAEVATFRGIRPTAGLKQYWPMGNTKAWEAGLTEVRRLAGRNANRVVMPTHDVFDVEGQVWFLDGATLLYSDDNHLTAQGVLAALPRIRECLAAAKVSTGSAAQR